MHKDNKKKAAWQKYIVMGLYLLTGMVCGKLIVNYIDAISRAGKTFGVGLLIFLFLEIYVALFIQIVVHEAGHLVFGLLSGYRYSSFRIGSFMWLKENGKIRFRKLSIAGTGGQCLMVPPETTGETMPYKLYNLGGVLMNGICSLLFCGLSLLSKGIPLLSVFLSMAAVAGFSLALTNGIPLRLGTVDNDGYNALSLGKSSEALRSFRLQMKVGERFAKGDRIKDMPEEWFVTPSPEGMQNSMTAVMGVFACNRLMDMHAFEKADQRMEELLEMNASIVGLHRGLLVCDRIYCELIGENRKEKLDGMLQKQQIKFMKSMKKFPGVLRTEYAYALLAEGDAAKAEDIKRQFDRCTRAYPYPSEVESERALLRIAQERAGARVR